MAMVDEKKYEKSKELDETHTDRTTQHVKEEPKMQLVATRCQVSDMDKVKTVVKDSKDPDLPLRPTRTHTPLRHTSQ